MSFNIKLQQTIEKKNSFVCVGLDTDISRIPAHISGGARERLTAFNKAIIDATAEHAAAYKLNSAFYEAEGVEGLLSLKETLDYIPDDTITIFDAKRGDIGNTAKMYAKSAFDHLGADSITLNPYMGYDSVEPFLSYDDRGSFILCLTSNKSAGDLQKIEDGSGDPLYLKAAGLIASWNTAGNAGLVVGATRPEELAGIRRMTPGMPLLIPGIGAQGGDLEKTVAAGIGKKREPALINSSRGIIFKSSGEDFADAAGCESLALKNAINEALEKL